MNESGVVKVIDAPESRTTHIGINFADKFLETATEQDLDKLGPLFVDGVKRKAHKMQCARFGHDWEEIPDEVALHAGTKKLCRRCSHTVVFRDGDGFEGVMEIRNA